MRYRIDVKHRGQDKMVGKLFERNGHHYFLHEEKAPTQQHYNTHAPGGIDVDVIWQLEQWEPVIGPCLVVHQNNQRTLALYADAFAKLGSRQHWDGRDRYFVDVDFWKEIDYVDPGERIQAIHVIERPPEKTKWKPIETPPPLAPSPQLGLF